MKYQNEYNLGYRMGCGYGDAVTIPYKENWYALAICIVTGKYPDESLRSMGVAIPHHYKNNTYEILANIIYTLHKVCGLRKTEIKTMLHIHNRTVNAALAFRRDKTDDLRVLPQAI